ncbi:MAG: hypothetical protein HOE90_10310 [Bacteriovoracaceae bacterium]|jgi:hypothetical protein|nr:hypothetical protein [Bacteriovoracaceae bacterium]
MKITYAFRLPDRDEKANLITIDLHDTSFLYQVEIRELLQWTELGFHQCSNCPLAVMNNSHCPVAANLQDIVVKFNDMPSFEKTDVYVETPERTYYKKTSLQDGLFSVFGVVMATSGCPHLDFLRPMARFHLPFATLDETMIRTCTNFLMLEYFKDPNLPLKLSGIQLFYEEVQKVNSGILERVRSIAKEDAGKNALVILNTFAQMIDIELNSNMESLKKYWDPIIT